VEEFKYLGTTLTNQNSIPEEIKSRLRSGNTLYHSVKKLLSSRFLPKNLKIKIFRTIILSVVFYVCETWSLILREESKLKVFENKVPRRIFGPRRDEVTGEWRRLYNEELNELYSSPNIVRVWVRRGGCIGSRWGSRRERDHWGDLGVDNMRMDLQEVGCEYMDWIGRAQDRDRWRTLVSAVMNLRVP